MTCDRTQFKQELGSLIEKHYRQGVCFGCMLRELEIHVGSCIAATYARGGQDAVLESMAVTTINVSLHVNEYLSLKDAQNESAGIAASAKH